MAFKANIPQPTDKKSVSQGDMLANFTALNTTFGVDHVTFDEASDNGKHNQVTFVDQDAVLGATVGNQLLLYNNAAAMFLNDAANNNYPLFDGTKAVTGYTRLGKGMVMEWGQSSSPSLADKQITPTTPVLSAIYHVQITPFTNNDLNTEAMAQLKKMNATDFIVRVSNLTGSTTPIAFFWMAIGIE